MKAETDRHQVSSEVAGTGSVTSSAEQTWRTPRKAGRWELCAHMRSPGTTKGGAVIMPMNNLGHTTTITKMTASQYFSHLISRKC